MYAACSTRQPARVRGHALVERQALLWIAIPRRRQRGPNGHHVIGAEADIDCPQVSQRAQHEARADKKHQRCRHLEDDERVAGQASASADRRPRTLLEGILQRYARRLQRRHDAEEHRGGQRYRQRESEQPQIEN
jgi:hypothetical protein